MIGTRLKRFRNDGLTFDVVDSGPLDGIPVVLLHGFPQRATSWATVAPLLHEAGLRTFAPDQRGYSPGARPRSRISYRLKTLAGDVAALVEAIGRPVHLVGHDWGAVAAWVAAARHAEKIVSLTAISIGHPRAWVTGLVTGDQARRSSYMAVFQTRRARTLMSERGGWGEELMRSWGMDDAMLDQLGREMVDDGALPGALTWYRALPLALPGDFAQVRVPTTYLWSDGDPIMSASANQRTERCVAAPYEFVTVVGAKHFLPNERPADVAEVIIRRIRSAEG